jgi:hypothetical protein
LSLRFALGWYALAFNRALLLRFVPALLSGA